MGKDSIESITTIVSILFFLLFFIAINRKEKKKKILENKKNVEVDKRFKINSKFDKIYSNMMNNINTEKLEEYRKSALKEERKNDKEVVLLVVYIVFVPIIIIVLNFLIFKNIFILFALIIILIVIPIYMYIHIKKNEKEKIKSSINKYYDYYNKVVIGEFLNQFEEKIDYSPNDKVENYVYKEAEFERFDNYYSRGLIKANLKNGYNIDMCNVITEYISTDNEGNALYYTLFNGIFATIKTPKPFNDVLYLKKDKKDKKYKNRNIIPNVDKIQLDSEEFENYFDVYSSNKIIAVQLLTSDVMEFLKEFQDSTNIDFELTLKKNRIFIRFFTNGIFGLPDSTQTTIDKEEFKRYYKILSFIIQFTYKITNLLDNLEY